MNPETIEFSLTHFMGSFTYSVRREGDAAAEGGGNFEQTFTRTEPYLARFEALPPWPGYLQQLDIR